MVYIYIYGIYNLYIWYIYGIYIYMQSFGAMERMTMDEKHDS